jgi:hypothetical protein
LKRASLVTVKTSLPSKYDIVSEQRTAFAVAAAALSELIDTGVELIKAVGKLPGRKRNAPNARLTSDELTSDEIAAQGATMYLRSLEAINEVIDRHNQAHDGFRQKGDPAKGKIKKHYLAEGDAKYRHLQKGSRVP